MTEANDTTTGQSADIITIPYFPKATTDKPIRFQDAIAAPTIIHRLSANHSVIHLDCDESSTSLRCEAPLHTIYTSPKSHATLSIGATEFSNLTFGGCPIPIYHVSLEIGSLTIRGGDSLYKHIREIARNSPTKNTLAPISLIAEIIHYTTQRTSPCLIEHKQLNDEFAAFTEELESQKEDRGETL